MDFSHYRTYKWVSGPKARKPDELTEAQFNGTPHVELANKGFRKAQSGDSDLYITY
jgi:hypothetical protein